MPPVTCPDCGEPPQKVSVLVEQERTTPGKHGRFVEALKMPTHRRPVIRPGRTAWLIVGAGIVVSFLWLCYEFTTDVTYASAGGNRPAVAALGVFVVLGVPISIMTSLRENARNKQQDDANSKEWVELVRQWNTLYHCPCSGIVFPRSTPDLRALLPFDMLEFLRTLSSNAPAEPAAPPQQSGRGGTAPLRG